MKKIISVISLAVLFLLTACTEEVMNELKSNTFDPNLSASFWNKEMRENTELWQQALPYCQANPLKVNCATVREVWARYNLSQGVVVIQPHPILRRALLRERFLNN